MLLAANLATATEPEQLVKSVCASCHSLEVITQKKATTEEWREVVKTMVGKGAALKPDEAVAVTEYLGKKYGNRAKELVQTVCILCHEFDRISTEALTRDQWAGEIRGMLAEGAPLNDEEFEIVVDYLTKTYGVKQDQPKRDQKDKQ